MVKEKNKGKGEGKGQGKGKGGKGKETCHYHTDYDEVEYHWIGDDGSNEWAWTESDGWDVVWL